MKIGISIPIYHNNELHADFTKQMFESIYSENHTLVTYAIINYTKPEYRPTPEKFPDLSLIKT